MSVETQNFSPRGLVIGTLPAKTRTITVTAAAIPAGSVLGRITATGLYIVSVAAASDGSQTPAAILAEPLTGASADKVCQAFFTGEFDAGLCSFGAGHTATTVNTAMAVSGRPIFLETLN